MSGTLTLFICTNWSSVSLTLFSAETFWLWRRNQLGFFFVFLIISKYTLDILTNVFVFSSMCGSLARISLEHLGCGQRHSLGSFDFCQQLLPRSAHWFTQEPWINHLNPDQNVHFWYTGARPCLCVYTDQTAGEKTKKKERGKEFCGMWKTRGKQCGGFLGRGPDRKAFKQNKAQTKGWAENAKRMRTAAFYWL